MAGTGTPANLHISLVVERFERSRSTHKPYFVPSTASVSEILTKVTIQDLLAQCAVLRLAYESIPTFYLRLDFVG